MHCGFPRQRLRRLRQAGWIRELVQEHQLGVRDLVWPTFVCEGRDHMEVVASMPGVFRYSIDVLIEEAKRARDLGIRAIAIFPVVPPHKKDNEGSEALNPSNLACQASAAIAQEVPDIGIIADIALDPYTLHGHDGILIDGRIANDASLEILREQALSQAQAGAHVVAPSDMMDGRVSAIRSHLDLHGLHDTIVLSYSAKYASAFYGPFRNAVGSLDALAKANKRSYQMNPANGDVAEREVGLDVSEGADMVMVKPAMPYLDVVYRIKHRFGLPTFAYQVSGEYAMLRAASDLGGIRYRECMLESLIAMKRAGADGIFTYAARDVAEWLSS